MAPPSLRNGGNGTGGYSTIISKKVSTGPYIRGQGRCRARGSRGTSLSRAREHCSNITEVFEFSIATHRACACAQAAELDGPVAHGAHLRIDDLLGLGDGHRGQPRHIAGVGRAQVIEASHDHFGKRLQPEGAMYHASHRMTGTSARNRRVEAG